jgi:hypothetical protein
MNLAHAHLLLNHLPPLGTLFGLLLLGAAAMRRSGELARASLVTFVAAALLALPTYFTGDPAEKLVENLPGVSEAAIGTHEDSAEVSLVAVLALGAFSLAVLWLRRGRDIPHGLLIASLVAALIVTALLAWTAHLGGLIHHAEIR